MSVFKKLFRPGSSGSQKGTSIVDTKDGRARIKRPFGERAIDDDQEVEGQFYPFILTNEIMQGGQLVPKGRLQGVDKAGNIPPYEADDPNVLRRIFGIEMPDE